MITACVHCGAPVEPERWSVETATAMRENNWCFDCAFWEKQAVAYSNPPPHFVVIDYHTYSLGSRTSGPMRGMAGRDFIVERQNGDLILCSDLWSGDDIPERFRSRPCFANTAKFFSGLKATFPPGSHFEACWNPAEPEYVAFFLSRFPSRRTSVEEFQRQWDATEPKLVHQWDSRPTGGQIHPKLVLGEPKNGDPDCVGYYRWEKL